MSKKTLDDYIVKSKKVASWESNNEGIHERVNFDDTIWGFDLAGGAYYHTPLRVTSIRENSRAYNAGIKPGDILRLINNIDTSTLQLQEAHDIIVESGIHLQLTVTAPDVEETTYLSYQDQIEDTNTKERDKPTIKIKKAHKEFKGAKTNQQWSSVWPPQPKSIMLYKESNCFLVPSNYESKQQFNLTGSEVNYKIAGLQLKGSLAWSSRS